MRLFVVLAVLIAASKEVNATDNAVPAAVQFNGRISARITRLFDELRFAYRERNPSIELAYDLSTSVQDTVDQMITNSKYEFAFIEGFLDLDETRLSKLAATTAVIPVFADSIVPMFNLPYGPHIDQQASSIKAKELVLTRALLVRIFSFNMTSWRDPDLLALQEQEEADILPNTTIKLVVHTQPGPEAQAIKRALKSWADDLGLPWPWGDSLPTDQPQWPAQFLANPNVVGVSHDYQVGSLVTVTADSLALFSLAGTLMLPASSFAETDNRHGQRLLEPSVSPAAVLQLERNPYNFTELAGGLINSPLQDTWPVGTPIQLLLRVANYSKTSTITCDQRASLWRFFHWITSDPSALNQLRLGGISSYELEDHLFEVLPGLSDIKCESDPNGPAFLAHFENPIHDGDGYMGMRALNAVFLAISALMMLAYVIKISRKLLTSLHNLVVYFTAIFIGSTLAYIGVFFFYEVPRTDNICQARQWCSILGFTLLLSALFSRGYQMHAVRRLQQSNNVTPDASQIPHTKIQIFINVTAVVVQLVLLIVWTAVDPFVAVQDDVDEVYHTYSWICRSEHVWVWWGLELAFVITLQLFGLFVVYLTWSLRHMVKESKWVSIAIYNSVSVLILMVALLTSMNVNEDNIFWVVGVSTMLLNFITVSSLFVPRLLRLRALADKDQSSDSSSDKNGKESNSTDSSLPVRRSTVDSKYPKAPSRLSVVVQEAAVTPRTPQEPGSAGGVQMSPLASSGALHRSSSLPLTELEPSKSTTEAFVTVRPSNA